MTPTKYEATPYDHLGMPGVGDAWGGVQFSNGSCFSLALMTHALGYARLPKACAAAVKVAQAGAYGED